MRIIGWMIRFEAVVAVAAYAAVALLLLADVMSREFLSQSIWGAQKAAVLCSVVAGMLGLTLATGRSAHFRPEFADAVLPFPWVEQIGDFISGLCFAMLAIFAIQFVFQSHEFQDRVAVINILLWPIQIVVPYAMISSAIKHFAFAASPSFKNTLRDVE